MDIISDLLQFEPVGNVKDEPSDAKVDQESDKTAFFVKDKNHTVVENSQQSKPQKSDEDE